MKKKVKPAPRAAAHAAAGGLARVSDHVVPGGDGNWLVRSADGQLVSRTLADPEVRAVMERQAAEKRADPEALRDYYRRQGVLTRSGNLTARYRAG